jgi:hypothetical protein
VKFRFEDPVLKYLGRDRRPGTTGTVISFDEPFAVVSFRGNNIICRAPAGLPLEPGERVAIYVGKMETWAIRSPSYYPTRFPRALSEFAGANPAGVILALAMRNNPKVYNYREGIVAEDPAGTEAGDPLEVLCTWDHVTRSLPVRYRGEDKPPVSFKFGDAALIYFPTGEDGTAGAPSVVGTGEVVEVTAAIADASGGASSTITFTVTLSEKPEDGEYTCEYETQDDTAIAGIDYTEKTGALTWPAGSTEVDQDIEVQTLSAADLPKTFFVRIFDPSENLEILVPLATGTIESSRAIGWYLAVDNFLICSGPTADFPFEEDTTITFEQTGGNLEAGIDYDLNVASPVVIPAGEYYNDPVIYPVLIEPSIKSGYGSLELTITDTSHGTLDPSRVTKMFEYYIMKPPRLTVTSPTTGKLSNIDWAIGYYALDHTLKSVPSGCSLTYTFTAAVDVEPRIDGTVNLDITGTATEGTHYNITAKSLTFGPGRPLSQSVTIEIIDTAKGSDSETTLTIAIPAPQERYNLVAPISATLTLYNRGYVDMRGYGSGGGVDPDQEWWDVTSIYRHAVGISVTPDLTFWLQKDYPGQKLVGRFEGVLISETDAVKGAVLNVGGTGDYIPEKTFIIAIE